MTEVETFTAYAAAFEVAYQTDDWGDVRNFFATDAVYEVTGGPPFGGMWEGRNQIVEHLVEAVTNFDRTYDERILEAISGPELRNGVVHMGWAVTYRSVGKPDLRVEGVEEAWITNGKITKLKDTMP